MAKILAFEPKPQLSLDEEIALRDQEVERARVLAAMDLDDVWLIDADRAEIERPYDRE